MENLRPNQQRAKTAIILIWVVLGLEIVSLVSGYFQYDLLQSVANGEAISTEKANFNDTREQLIAILYTVTFIVSAVTFIQWFRRAYYNLHLKVKNLSHTEGWAAGAWFVPILSLFRPYQIMKELYHETKVLLTSKGLISEESLSTNTLGFWWALWIINNLVGQFVFRFSARAETVDELIISTGASMFANIIGIPLALIAIKVIKDYSNVEPLMHELVDDVEPTTDYTEAVA